MEIWLVIIVTACIAALLNTFFSISKSNLNLPPGPRSVPILSTVLWLLKPSTERQQILKGLSSKFGPIVTLSYGSRPLIFICDRALAHQALIQYGAIFVDRPKPPLTVKIMSSNQHSINSAGHGPTWRLLRRNLTSQILHPSKSKEFSSGRKWALAVLLSRLKRDHELNNVSSGINVAEEFRFAMFCFFVFMCFGDKMDKTRIREIEEVVSRPLASLSRYNILNVWPCVTRVVLRSRWNEFYNMRKKQEEVLIPYIRGRIQAHDLHEKTTCYVDTLIDLELSEDGNVTRKLSEDEIVAGCLEFFAGGTDTTITTLQWIMANLVKYPHIQAKLFEDIKRVVGEEAEQVEEDDLSKMPYLKAVVLEGLRRHPPSHFLLPHAVTQEVELGGYTVPENAIISFLVAEMGWDPEVWDDPMEFRPERFMSREGRGGGIEEEFDITGSREIKMIPFGAGRRMCPASGFSLHQLEYYVANLIWKFQWTVPDGKEIDLTEKHELSFVMKNPLHANILPRQQGCDRSVLASRN